MGKEEGIIGPTWQEKLLFYTTAFFILLGTFSLFAFLFLVPFVIDPAFTTIFMEFDETPAMCVTVGLETKKGASNCTWASCREGCTKEVYECTQISVNYKRGIPPILEGDLDDDDLIPTTLATIDTIYDYQEDGGSRQARAARDDSYLDNDLLDDAISNESAGVDDDYLIDATPTGLQGNGSEWYYTGAKLFPNVKGCGYPPILNCSIFLKKYKDIGTNFSCFYSKIDPGLVISELDMWQVHMNLVYAMAIPIPSFIISVIYLTIAYFKIYNEDEETELLEENAEAMDMDGETQIGITPVPNTGTTPVQPASEALTPGSEAFREDLASFGHQYKVAMADELSRESFAVPNSNSNNSIPGELVETSATIMSSEHIDSTGVTTQTLDYVVQQRVTSKSPSSPNDRNVCKTMTTSISTAAGDISEL